MKKLLIGLLTTATAASILTGCSSSSKPAETTAAATTASADVSAESSQAESESTASPEIEPLSKVTMMCNFKAVEAPGADNDLLKAIAEHTGTNLEMIWVPNDAYEEKINTLIASSSLPEITVVRETTSAGFIDATRAGMFWDLTPYLDQFENLSSIDPNIMNNVRTDGKQFLIPRTRYTIRMGIVLRSDWLKNLGLELPTTIDEFTEILHAFTYDDPDGNGKDDTYGLAMYNQGLKNFGTQMSVYMGGPNNWMLDETSGNIVSQYDTEEYTRALTWFQNCYADGLINKDFSVVTDKTANFTDGYAGAVFVGNIEDATTTLNKLTQVNPDASADVVQILLDGENGAPHIPGYQGYTGAIAIPKTAVKDETHLLQILSFLDKLGDPEMVDLFNWGVEGETYTIVNGKVSQTEEQLSIYADKYNLLRQITPFYASRNLESNDLTPLAEKVQNLLDSNAEYAVFDPTLPFISETETELGGTLGELPTFIEDSAIKYVIGELDADGWSKAVQTWKDMGGEQVAAEFTEQYHAYN